MLESIEANGSLIGHSERRRQYGETDAQCNKKIKLALIKVLLLSIVMETLEQKRQVNHTTVVRTRLK
jgi:triosephosphate isomerase